MSAIERSDPEIWAAIKREMVPAEVGPGADRLGKLHQRGRAGSCRHDPHQQIRRGLSRPSLLRRLRSHRHDRRAGPPTGLRALRLRACQRPAARRLAGQHGGLPHRAQAGRHLSRNEPGPGRTPDARQSGEFLGAALQRGRLRRARERPSHRLRSRRQPGPRAQAETDRRRRECLSPGNRPCQVRGDRPLGRCATDGRHGPLRRAGCGGRAQQPRPRRRLRHLDLAQDAPRPAVGIRALQGGARQGPRQNGLSRHAGGAARAHRRRQGDLLPRGDGAQLQGLTLVRSSPMPRRLPRP